MVLQNVPILARVAIWNQCGFDRNTNDCSLDVLKPFSLDIWVIFFLLHVDFPRESDFFSSLKLYCAFVYLCSVCLSVHKFVRKQTINLLLTQICQAERSPAAYKQFQYPTTIPKRPNQH